MSSNVHRLLKDKQISNTDLNIQTEEQAGWMASQHRGQHQESTGKKVPWLQGQHAINRRGITLGNWHQAVHCTGRSTVQNIQYSHKELQMLIYQK